MALRRAYNIVNYFRNNQCRPIGVKIGSNLNELLIACLGENGDKMTFWRLRNDTKCGSIYMNFTFMNEFVVSQVPLILNGVILAAITNVSINWRLTTAQNSTQSIAQVSHTINGYSLSNILRLSSSKYFHSRVKFRCDKESIIKIAGDIFTYFIDKRWNYRNCHIPFIFIYIQIEWIF